MQPGRIHGSRATLSVLATFAGVPDQGNGLFQSWTGAGPGGGSLTYADIVKNYATYQQF